MKIENLKYLLMHEKKNIEEEKVIFEKLEKAMETKQQLFDQLAHQKDIKSSVKERLGSRCNSAFQIHSNLSTDRKRVNRDEGSLTFRCREKSLPLIEILPETEEPSKIISQIMPIDLVQLFVDERLQSKVKENQTKKNSVHYVEIQENRGNFFNKIKHYTKIINFKEKSNLVFKDINDKVQKQSESPRNKSQPKTSKININNYKQEINQRIETFSAFALTNTGHIKKNALLDKQVSKMKERDNSKKEVLKSKPMGVADLWSKNYHAEVMKKAEHKKFKLRIQRYLHILHRQGMGHSSISRMMIGNFAGPEATN